VRLQLLRKTQLSQHLECKMHPQSLLLVALSLPLHSWAETVLGLYIFSRHGDRTSKSHPPTSLTNLGQEEVDQSGTWFRNQYVTSSAPSQILGIHSDLVSQAQVNVEAPEDLVIFNSAQVFLQALYPPVGQSDPETLRNGSTIQSPFNGLQYIPIYTDDAISSGQEDAAWLQGGTSCLNAEVSSNEFFTSTEYETKLNQSNAFYASLSPVLNSTYSALALSYENAYLIWDELNVALIHNTTIPSSSILTPGVFDMAGQLAADHEWALAYNASSSIRAIAGAVLAAQVVDHLNSTITGGGKSKLSIQFGAYGSFQSFWGLAGLASVSPIFKAIPDYASTMVFELVTNATATSTQFPSPQDISVRFLFHNGTVSNASTPTAYPLFNSTNTLMPWMEFTDSMNKVAVNGQTQWCQVCGNSTGACAGSSSGSSSASPSTASSSTGKSGGLTVAEGGVIGAMVTLAVLCAAAALFLIVGGFRIVKKHRAAATAGAGSGTSGSPDGRVKA
jgi:hypothetical protein